MKPAIDITKEQRKILVGLLHRYLPDVEVWAYGSRVKWTARPNSDLDLVAFAAPGLDSQVAELKDALAESDLPFLVDLHIWDDVPKRFHEIIRNEYAIVQESKVVPASDSLGNASEFSIPVGWQVLSLEAAMEAIIDYRGKSPKKTSFGIPLITAKVVKNGRIMTPDEFIAPADYEEWMRRGLPRSGDVLITTEAPLGEVAQLDGRKIALAQRLIALRGEPGLLDNTFLKFMLQSQPIQDALRSRSTGTTVSGIRQSELRQIQLLIPPLEEQLSIARILGSLEDKFEINRKMNETLEAMARALFRSWFVDFDPVHAKAEGRDTGLPADIAALFPDSFEFSELGPIPKSWRVGKVCEVAENSRRGISPDEITEKTPYIALQHMPRKCIALSDWGIADGVESGKFAFNADDILFGKLRPYFHKVGVAPTDGVCSTDILVITPRRPEWFGFVLGHVSSDAFVEHTNAGSTGTKMPRTNWTDMANYPVILPPKALAKVYTAEIRPVVSRITASIHQNRALASLRDTLLSKLISGELRMNSAAQLVEAAL